MKRIHLCVLIAMLSFCEGAFGKDIVKADIYYVSWFSMTRASLTVENVRMHYDARIEIADSNEAQRFAQLLRHRQFEQTGMTPHPDVRLVIDLQMDDGTTQTWFADRIRLYSPGGASNAPIDRSFREQFEFGGHELEALVPGTESAGH